MSNSKAAGFGGVQAYWIKKKLTGCYKRVVEQLNALMNGNEEIPEGINIGRTVTRFEGCFKSEYGDN